MARYKLLARAQIDGGIQEPGYIFELPDGVLGPHKTVTHGPDISPGGASAFMDDGEYQGRIAPAAQDVPLYEPYEEAVPPTRERALLTELAEHEEKRDFHDQEIARIKAELDELASGEEVTEFDGGEYRGTEPQIPRAPSAADPGWDFNAGVPADHAADETTALEHTPAEVKEVPAEHDPQEHDAPEAEKHQDQNGTD